MDDGLSFRESPRRDIAGFILVLVAASIPFYIAGPLIGSLSAVTRGNIPGAALAFVCPAVAAAVMAARTGTGRLLLERLAQPPRGILFTMAALAVMPAVVTLSAVLTGHARGFGAPGVGALALAAVYLVSASAEEIGWTAFLLPRVLQVCGEIPAGIFIGLIWSLWHVLSKVQAGHTAMWITGQIIFTVVLRVFIVLITVGAGGSIWLAVLTNASYNLAWSLSPGAGAAYDPWMTALLTGAAAVVVVYTVRGAKAPQDPQR